MVIDIFSCYNYYIEKTNQLTDARSRNIENIVGFVRKCIVFLVIFLLIYWMKRFLSIRINSEDIIYTKVGKNVADNSFYILIFF